MRNAVDLNFGPEQPVPYRPTNQTGELNQRATAANTAFDASVRQFLRHWIEQGSAPDTTPTAETEADLETFIEQGALRTFFKHHDHPLRHLLADKAIARHLLRPVDEVFFENDAYEPMLARFERRIYNLAAHREHLEISFRYNPANRQNPDGDSLSLIEMPERQGREDIGMYFGTRRSDETALNLLACRLNREAALGSDLPVHIITEGYMAESLARVRTMTETLHDAADNRLQCFLIQRRHAADDRHLGAALLLMNPQQPALPQRIIFCDTLNPNGTPPWWHKFKHKVDVAFPQPESHAPASDRLEDGGVNLQRLHDGVAVRHQDIDCAFYSAAMVQALIQVARATPDLIIYGSIAALVSAMTAQMTDYFEQADQPRDPVLVREANVVQRWNTGRQALRQLIEPGSFETLPVSANAERIELTVPIAVDLQVLALSNPVSGQADKPLGREIVLVNHRLRQRTRRPLGRRPDKPRPRRVRRLRMRARKRLA